jgi:uncharacterized protein YbjT (DUF2867 family)
MFVITGASGNNGSKVSGILLSQGQKVRVVARNADRMHSLIKKGAEAAVGDLRDTGFLTTVFAGATAVFAMIPPHYTAGDFRAYQNETGASIAAAIQSSGVRHVVNLSSQGAELSEGTGPIKGLHDQEERLNRLEDVNILHLRPAYYMENLFMFIPMIKKANITGSAIKGDREFSMIATTDIAAFAAERLLQRDFIGKSVRGLLGQRDVSLDEAITIIGRKINRPELKYVQFPYEEARKGLVAAGLSEDVSSLMIEMSKAINDGLFAVNVPRTKDNTTRTSIEEFADTFAKKYESS